MFFEGLRRLEGDGWRHFGSILVAWDLEAIILEAGRAGSWKMEPWDWKLGPGNLITVGLW